MASPTRFYYHFSLSSSLPLILLLHLFLFSLWNTTPSALADQQQPLQKLPRPKLKFCKLDVLLECFFEPMANFTNTPLGTGFPITEQDFEQWCFVLHDYFPYCGRAWLRRCASPLHHDFLDRLFGQPMRQSVYSICSEGNHRKEWLTLAECVIHRVKLHPNYRSRCVRQLQANMEHAHLAFFARHRSGPRWWRHFCCSFNAWEQCITDELARECGPAASAIFPRMFGGMNFNVMADVCPPAVYGPSSPEQCPPEEVEAPAEYVPLGLASSNFFSRAFSYACPNVGWGVIKERDF